MEMKEFVRISKAEEINEVGLVRALVSGHGVLPGKLRMPLLIDGRFYYRITLKNGVKFRRVSDLVECAFGETDMVFDMEWYRRARFIVFQHNLMLHLKNVFTPRRSRYDKARILAQQETDEAIQDDFSNDRWAG